MHAINVVCTRTHTLWKIFNLPHCKHNCTTDADSQQCDNSVTVCPIDNSVTILQHLVCVRCATVWQFCNTLNVHGLFQFCSRLRTKWEQNENDPPAGCVVIVCSMRPFWGVFWKPVDTLFNILYNSSMKYILWTPCALLVAYVIYIIAMAIWGTFNG